MEAWHVQPEDWDHHRQYDDWLLAYEEMFERTDTEWGEWTIVEATDRRFTRVKIFQTLIKALEERLAAADALPDPALWEEPEIAEEEDVQDLEAETGTVDELEQVTEVELEAEPAAE
jgi:hypothetical protein